MCIRDSFWIDQSDGTNVVLLGSDTEGTTRMETEDAKGYKMVKEIIRVAVEDGGGYTDCLLYTSDLRMTHHFQICSLYLKNL